ncbi:MAG: protein kinase, partial [Saprospiraceae bacterium]
MAEVLIYESKKSKIYHLDESEWNCPVILKILNLEFPSPADIEQFNNEFDIVDGLEIAGIRKVLKKARIKNKHAIYLEYLPFSSIREVFEEMSSIETFLQTAIQIAETIGELHQLEIIHKDLNYNNILVDPSTAQIKVIDFGLSTKINMKQAFGSSPEMLEGTLSFNSPEQTGRMNRMVDYRS